MRIFLIALLVFFPGHFLHAAAKDGFEFSTGWHYDVVDYDGAAQQFFRHRYRVRERGREIFLSHTAMDGFEKHHLNWYLSLGEDKGFSLTGGSFSVRLGSGLLFGPRRYQSGDILSFRESWREVKPVKPSAAANPYYSMQGMVLGYRSPSGSGGGGIQGFASLRQRYVPGEEFEEGLLESSPSSLNSHTEETSRRHEKIYLRTAGAAGEMSLGRYLFLQVFGYYSDISDTEGRRLSWQGVGDTGPLRGAAGSGILLQYRDASLASLFEGLYSTGLSPTGSGKGNAWALRWALRFRHRSIDFSTSLVSTGRDFYAPESGESVRPFTRGDMLLRHRPVKQLEIRGMVNSEIHRVPGGWHRSMPVTIREGVEILWRPSLWIFRGEVRNVRYEKEESGWSRQYRAVAAWNVPGIFRIRGHFQGREKNGLPFSYGWGADMRGTLLGSITLSGAWFQCHAAAGNPLYVSTGAVPGRVATASRIEGEQHLAVAGMKIKIFRIDLLGRYEALLGGGELLSWHLDVSCGGKF